MEGIRQRSNLIPPHGYLVADTTAFPTLERALYYVVRVHFKYTSQHLPCLGAQGRKPMWPIHWLGKSLLSGQ